MIPRALVVPVLWLTTAALPAQFFLSAETQTRRVAHVRWLGLSGEQSVAFEYGQPKWRPDYERFAQQESMDRVLLGNGALTTLRTDVDLAFGAQKLARGRWYVGARRDEQQRWSLALFAADKVDAGGRGASYVLSTEPDLRVPMRMTRENESVELFEITLTDTRRAPRELALAMAWGPFRLRTDL